MKSIVLFLIVQLINFSLIVLTETIIFYIVDMLVFHIVQQGFVEILAGFMVINIIVFLFYWLLFKAMAYRAHILTKAITMGFSNSLFFFVITRMVAFGSINLQVVFILVVFFSGAFTIPFSERWISHGLHKIGKK